MRTTHVFAGVAVSDFAEACHWYERLFDAPPDALPTDGEAIWHTAQSASVYITTDRARAGRALLTLAVKSLEDQRVDLARRGLVFDDGAELNGLQRLIVADPDGNTIKLFEDPAEP